MVRVYVHQLFSPASIVSELGYLPSFCYGVYDVMIASRQHVPLLDKV